MCVWDQFDTFTMTFYIFFCCGLSCWTPRPCFLNIPVYFNNRNQAWVIAIYILKEKRKKTTLLHHLHISSWLSASLSPFISLSAISLSAWHVLWRKLCVSVFHNRSSVRDRYSLDPTMIQDWLLSLSTQTNPFTVNTTLFTLMSYVICCHIVQTEQGKHISA